MEDLGYRLWQIADKALEKSMSRHPSFYGFLDLCKRESENSAFFVEADLEGIDIAVHMYHMLVNRWLAQYRYQQLCSSEKAAQCYSIVSSLFRKEDFVSVFKDAEGLIKEILNLKSLEHEVCGDGYSPQRVSFKRLYDAVTSRLKVSLA